MYKNKEDQIKYLAKHYKENKNLYKKRAKESTRRYRSRNLTFANRVKTILGCKYCGFRKHPAAIDFHHIKGKDRNIAKMVNSGCSIDNLKKEMKKCIVLCSNCHRIEHYGPIAQ